MPDRDYLKWQVEDHCGGYAKWFDVDGVVDELVAMHVLDIDEIGSDGMDDVLYRHKKGEW